MQKQHGFTFVEVIIVILVIGILSAVAIPKFIDLTEEVHDKVARSTYGSFQSGIMLAHMKWAASGGTAGPPTNSQGWPTGSTGGGGMNATRCSAVWHDVLTNSDPIKTGALTLGADGWWTIGIFQLCFYIYLPDTTMPLHYIRYNADNGDMYYFGP